MSGTAGIRIIHQRACATHRLGRCTCGPSYQAVVIDPGTRRRLRRNFPTQDEAIAWRTRSLNESVIETASSKRSKTIHELGAKLIPAMKSGVVRTRSGDRYKPSTIRSYQQTLNTHVYPELGGLRLSELRRHHAQELVDRMLAAGASASTVGNALMPLRVICRRAIRAEQLLSSPLEHVDMPAVRGGRDRVATPTDAAKLVTTLEGADRAIWATAFYAGPRRGELMALEIDAIDLDRRRLEIRWGWDMKEGQIPPKSRAGTRTIPISEALAILLEEHLARLGWSSGLIFGRSPTTPFEPSVVTQRAYRTWRRHGLECYSLHEARHTYVTFLLAAGVPIKAVSTYAGHASISITLDRYGHLLPGNEDEAARRLDVFLGGGERADRAAP